ncbi:MAG: type II secretion system protein GspL [Halioglobus sp.]|nr:type II secretion system protein GspL [Halioglobus sp.]
MHNSAVIRLVTGRLAWYAPGASDEPRWLDDTRARDDLVAAVAQQRLATCFAVPGADVRLLQLQLTAEEKKHIGKSLPFMLEERVAADIDQLHFASAVIDRLELAVALCSIHRMQEWQALLGDIPGVRLWLPEPLLLPWRDGEWCIVLEGDDAIVRYDRCGGFTIESALLPAMLEALLAAGAEPTAVIFYGREQARDVALLPQALQAKAQWRRGNLYSALLLGEPPQPALNLLQGAFAARLPVARWWREWRAVAALLALAFGLQLVATFIDYRQLQGENLSLRGAVESSYRRAFPQGAIVDAETQLRRQLGSLRGSGEASGFVHLVERVGEAISANAGTTIDSINYNFGARGGEMRLNIVATDFDAVERVRADINKAGLVAEMESSSADGDRVRARLRVGDKS